MPSKPGLHPKWQESPRNPARQEIDPGEGGVLASASRDARAVERKVQGDEKLPLSSLTRAQQSFESVSFRRPVRKRHALRLRLRWMGNCKLLLPVIASNV